MCSGEVIATDGRGQDELYEQRNTLAVALRRVHALRPEDAPGYGIMEPGEEAEWLVEQSDRIVMDALEQVFPGDPFGTEGLYDCPAADGINYLERKEISDGE